METSILLVLLTVTCTEVAGKPGQKTCSNLLTNPGGCEEFAQLYKSNHDNSDPCSYDKFKEVCSQHCNEEQSKDCEPRKWSDVSGNLDDCMNINIDCFLVSKEFIKTEPNVNRAVDLCLKSNGWFRHLCQGFCDTCTDVDAVAKKEELITAQKTAKKLTNEDKEIDEKSTTQILHVLNAYPKNVHRQYICSNK